jgi:2-succinyl-6-hydroxy-2,4-cyclohexadiene-1-carboxylate synthase
MNSAVLIHGFTGSPASFDDLARRLAARRPRLRLYRPALLGHGANGANGDRVVRCFEQEIDRLAQAIARAGFSGSHLCGYSLGARVALGLVARHSFLFSGATLIGVHPGLSSPAERALRVGSDERWCQLLTSRGVAAFLDAWQAQPIFASQRALSVASAAEQRRIRSAHAADGLCRSLRVLGLGQMPNYRGVAQRARLTLGLVVGDRDDKFLTIARGLAAASPRVALDLVAGAGHNVLIEAPEYVEHVLLRALAA